MPTEHAAAECAELTKEYRTPASSVLALRGVTARFARNALTVVAGPSGSGKSSLLRLLAGLDRPTSGRLEVDGVRVDRASPRTLRRLRRRGVGYVFQRASDNFLPYLTVGEHVRMSARAAARPPRIEADELLELLGISQRAEHLPSELSGGEQARAAIAQVMAGGSSIVVADEPTAELDTVSSTSVLRAVLDLVGLGVTFVLASHDPAVIRASNDVLELDHGLLRRKVRVGPDAVPLRGLRASEPVWTDDPDDPPDRPRRVTLEAASVTKTYRRGAEVVHAIREASFSVRDGELVGVVGRSGSGKTSLLNVVAGWERPDAGHVSLWGRDPSRDVPTWSEVAVLPQRLGLIEELTIRENVEYPARLSGRLADVAGLVDELVRTLGLGDLQDRFPKEASVGEQQRAALARALVLSPALMLADEPTGHQNADWAGAMFRTLRDATARGTSCLAASHDETMLRFVDRVLSMSDGVLTPSAEEADADA